MIKLKNILYIGVVSILLVTIFTTCEKLDKESPAGSEFRPSHLSGVDIVVVSEITTESAICNAAINFIGSDSITLRGICYSKVSVPTIEDSVIISGAGTGSFELFITNIAPETNYYVRAFAYSDAGYSYGEGANFTTLPLTVPVLELDTIYNITYESAFCSANVTYNGGTEVIASGICVSTTSNPDVDDIVFNEVTTLEEILVEFLNLDAHTKYYIRAFAQNEIGIAYSEAKIFTTDWLNCGEVQDVEGHTYKTVTIGEQCWLRSNLRANKYANGDYIQEVTVNETWENLTQGAYCYYSNQDHFVEYYGNLYNWYAISDSRGICPSGWRVATDNDWKILEEELGMNTGELDLTGWRGTNQANDLKMEGTDLWNYPNSGATNSSGFSAVPGGYRSSTGQYNDSGASSTFWTSTENGETVYYRSIAYDDARIFRNASTKNNGFSVRCVKE